MFWLNTGLDLLFCHRIRIPPQMQNSAQFGNLITSAGETPLVNAKRRCNACVVFLRHRDAGFAGDPESRCLRKPDFFIELESHLE
jgi:hypothetical protein